MRNSLFIFNWFFLLFPFSSAIFNEVGFWCFWWSYLFLCTLLQYVQGILYSLYGAVWMKICFSLIFLNKSVISIFKRKHIEGTDIYAKFRVRPLFLLHLLILPLLPSLALFFVLLFPFYSSSSLSPSHPHPWWFKPWKGTKISRYQADEELKIIRWYTPLGEVNQAI